MENTTEIREILRSLIAVYIIGAALDLLVEDDSAVLGFRTVYGLAVVLYVLQTVLRLIR